MKNLIKIALISGMFAACGQQTSDVQSVQPNMGDEQKITDVKVSCLELGSVRSLDITANGVFKSANDSLHILTSIDGDKSEKEFSLNERSGGLSVTKSLPRSAVELEFEIFAKGSTPGVTHSLLVDLDEVCSGKLTEDSMDALAASINDTVSVYKPAPKQCTLGIQIGAACIQGQMPKKLETWDDELERK
ncbi:hypothetical protein N9W79_01975 [bacterium]|nr:hypothetical protein [bacterium]